MLLIAARTVALRIRTPLCAECTTRRDDRRKQSAGLTAFREHWLNFLQLLLAYYIEAQRHFDLAWPFAIKKDGAEAHYKGERPFDVCAHMELPCDMCTSRDHSHFSKERVWVSTKQQKVRGAYAKIL